MIQREDNLFLEQGSFLIHLYMLHFIAAFTCPRTKIQALRRTAVHTIIIHAFQRTNCVSAAMVFSFFFTTSVKWNVSRLFGDEYTIWHTAVWRLVCLQTTGHEGVRRKRWKKPRACSHDRLIYFESRTIKSLEYRVLHVTHTTTQPNRRSTRRTEETPSRPRPLGRSFKGRSQTQTTSYRTAYAHKQQDKHQRAVDRATKPKPPAAWLIWESHKQFPWRQAPYNTIL